MQADNTIAITTGSAATSITDNFDTDTVTVDRNRAGAEHDADACRLGSGDSERPGREHHGQFADRCTEP